MPGPIVMLAIETSQRQGAIALRDPGGVIWNEALRSTQKHEDDLLPAIDRIIRDAGLLPADVDAVAVSIGPGGFTGLRIAITAAKMLAETLNVKVAAVPSALVVAGSTPSLRAPALIVLASKDDRAWCTLVETCPTLGRRIVGEPGLRTAEEVDWSEVKSLACDNFAPPGFRARAQAAGLPIADPQFLASVCLELGDRMLAAGQATRAEDLLPLYARPPEAVTVWEAREAEGITGNGPADSSSGT